MKKSNVHGTKPKKVRRAGISRRKYTLKELLAKITLQNRHAETDWGPPQGKEFW